jgi:uncharacterized protein
LEVVTPLADAKITKAEIRRLSKEYGLSNWNRHSGSCLATRIPHGNPISPEELQKIDECENYLQSLDFLGCRVRTQGNIAIIELASGDKHRFLNPEVQENVKNSFLCSGFTGIQLSSTERKM